MTTKKKTKPATKRKRTKSKLPDHEIERIREVTPTINELRIIDVRRDYRVLRDRHFQNSIPPVEEILIGFLPRKEMKRLGNGDEVCGACLPGFIKKLICPYVIVLADDGSVEENRHNLLHEMAHMRVNIKYKRRMGHGETFKREQRRLMAAGAYDGWL